jgi:hypothetical protein
VDTGVNTDADTGVDTDAALHTSDVCERVARALAHARSVDLAFLRNVGSHAPLLVRFESTLEKDKASTALVALCDSRVDPRAQKGAALARAVCLERLDVVRTLCLDPRVDPLQELCAQANEAIAHDRADIVDLLLSSATPANRGMHVFFLLKICIVVRTTPAVWRTVLAYAPQDQVQHELFEFVTHAALHGAHEILLDLLQDGSHFRVSTQRDIAEFDHLFSMPSWRSDLPACEIPVLLRTQGNRGIRLLYRIVECQLFFEFFSEPCFLQTLSSAPVALSVAAITAAWTQSEAYKSFQKTPEGAAKRAAADAMRRLPPTLCRDVGGWFERKDRREERREDQAIWDVCFFLTEITTQRPGWIRAWSAEASAASAEVLVLSREDFDARVARFKERYARVISLLLSCE